MNYGAIILAGGKSSRMGQDKGLLKFEGKCFVKYSLDAIEGLCGKPIIVSSNAEYDQFNCLRLEDEVVDLGPLAGIQKGLRNSNYDQSVVLSSDIPKIKSSIISRLLEESHDTDICVAKCGDKVHPLIGVYSKHILPELDHFLSSGGRSVMEFIARFEIKIVEFDLDLENSFLNVNTKEEFENLGG